MKIQAVPISELSSADFIRWHELHRSNVHLGSPYFHPSFARAVGDVRNDVRVAILESDNIITGFFPFHFHRAGIARPLGLSLSDFHGIITTPNTWVDPRELAHRCGFKVFPFDHLLASQMYFAPYVHETEVSPIIDLRDGFAAYVKTRRSLGSETFMKLGRKIRKLEREFAPLSFKLHVDDDAVLRQIMQWKSDQYRRSGLIDDFSKNWVVELLRIIVATKLKDFRGNVSALFLGDQLIAGHIGVSTNQVAHHWFPSYDRSWHRYSPGAILLLRMLEQLADKGFQRIDLGKGGLDWKSTFMTGSIDVCTGVFSLPSPAALGYRTGVTARKWLKASPLKPVLSKVVLRTREIRNRLATPKIAKGN